MPITASVADRLAQDVVTAIIALNLQGTPDVTGSIGANVSTTVIPERLEAESSGLPCIRVECTRGADSEEPGTFEERFVTHRVRCWILDQLRTNYQQMQADYTSWLEILTVWADGLVNYTATSPTNLTPSLFANTPEVNRVDIEEITALMEESANRTMAVGRLTILCHASIARVRG